MKIVIAGMKRSGSTWLYNVVRVACEKYYGDVYVSGFHQYDETNDSEVHIVKEHNFIKNLAEKADFVFTSYRNYEEVRKSLKRFNKDEDYLSTDNINKKIIDLLYWNMYSNYMMLYEKMEDNPEKIINRVLEVLGIDININEVKKEVDNIEPPINKEYDEKTLMFKNHITQ